jgi:hypothetical protein
LVNRHWSKRGMLTNITVKDVLVLSDLFRGGCTFVQNRKSRYHRYKGNVF